MNQTSIGLSADDDSLRVTVPSQRALIRTLSTAHRYRLPAATLVYELSGEFSGQQGRSLEQVAKLMSANVPAIDALEQTPGALDQVSLLALRLASETGTLPETYDALLRREPDARVQAGDENKTAGMELFQLSIGLLVAWILISFLMTFIVPTFEAMFDEFGLELPAPMLLLIGISRYGGMLFFLGLLAFSLLLVTWIRLEGYRWRPWRVPDSDASASASLPALLALVVASGRPIGSGLATLARFHPIATIRGPIAMACRSIEHGVNVWMALYQHGLIDRREAESLQLAPDRGTEVWLLRQATFTRRHRRAVLRHAVIRFFSLACLLVFAAIVSLAAVAVFTTLYSMVGSLA